MPYASNGAITQQDMSGIDGWIYINEYQYTGALQEMLKGRIVNVDNGFRVIDPPKEEEGNTVPDQISNAQGKAALVLSGRWTAVEQYVEGIEDPIQKQLAKISIDSTQYWNRNSPMLMQMADAVGISEQELDELFLQASEIIL